MAIVRFQLISIYISSTQSSIKFLGSNETSLNHAISKLRLKYENKNSRQIF